VLDECNNENIQILDNHPQNIVFNIEDKIDASKANCDYKCYKLLASQTKCCGPQIILPTSLIVRYAAT
jgi:hypothetical protein